MSEALGWSLVPPTVVRDGPYGIGSVQLFIEHSPDAYFSVPAERNRDAAERIALLDLLLNNADRKSEHCLSTRWMAAPGQSITDSPSIPIPSCVR